MERNGQKHLPPFLHLSDARARMGFWLDQARHHDGWIPVMKHRRIIGALIGPRDLAALETASQASVTYSEYVLWERRARIEQLNEALHMVARDKLHGGEP